LMLYEGLRHEQREHHRSVRIHLLAPPP
jgi:hypothetical protein